MPRTKTAKPRTAKTAQPKTAHAAKHGEVPNKLKPSPPVAGNPAENDESASTKNSSIVVIAEPETSSPAEATTSSVPATITQETVYTTTIKPRFFAEQPSRRAVPALAPEDYEALKANIQELGRILVPISITAAGVLIDGYARLQIAGELNLFCPWIVEYIGTDQIDSLARTLNLARRQLDADQKRQLIADELVEDAEAAKLGQDRRSFNLIAQKLGVACGTVIKVSQKLISEGKITPITEAIGADGKVRSAPKPREPKAKAIPGAKPVASSEKSDAGTGAVACGTAIDAPAATATTPAASTTPPTTAVVLGEPSMPRIFEPGLALAEKVSEPEPVPAKLPDDPDGDDHAGFDRGGFADEDFASPAGRGDHPPGAFTCLVLDWLGDLGLAESDIHRRILTGDVAVTMDDMDSFFREHPDALPSACPASQFQVARELTTV